MAIKMILPNQSNTKTVKLPGTLLRQMHDFTWAADPDYIHDRITGPNDIELHFLYKNDPKS